MTEQQAPTSHWSVFRTGVLDGATWVISNVPDGDGNIMSEETARVLSAALATPQPSPASLQERMRAALVELFHAEWSSGGNRYVEAQNAALRLGEELATPQPSPTGPVEAQEPPAGEAPCEHSLLKLSGLGSDRQCYECVKCGAVGLTASPLASETTDVRDERMCCYGYMAGYDDCETHQRYSPGAKHMRSIIEARGAALRPQATSTPTGPREGEPT